jgi:cytochrome d ubiquinol oxidase subunit I
MAMPALMTLAEWRYRRRGDEVYRELAQRWAKGTAILFAVGAISGTVLSFELGLLWPHFMERAGVLIGMPFSLEGLAFFLESIALGVYLYGWDRVGPRVHLASGVVVALSGAASGVLVIAVNSFMNTPRGFELDAAGNIVNANLWEAFFTPAFPTQATHMLVAAYASLGFAVLGIHALRLRKSPRDRFHSAAFRLVLPMVLVAAPLQVLTGDLSAKHVAQYQPAKLAAAEALYETTRGASLVVGGWPVNEGRELRYALHLPRLLSVLAKGDPDAEVTGLADIPPDERPPVLVTHLAFQLMVGCGGAMLAFAAWGAVLLARRRRPERSRAFLTAAVLVAPLGLLAVEAGWVVTEVGRQPWIIYGVMRVSEAVTPMPGLIVSFWVSVAIYVFLGGVVTLLMFRHVLSVPPQPAEGSSPEASRRAGEAAP